MPNGYEQEQSDKRVRYMLAVERLVDMATKLANSVSDAALDEAREAWGNTNVAVVKHWREQTRAALAPFQEADDGTHH